PHWHPLASAPAALELEAANPRHAYEWQVFEELQLPQDKLLVLGVLVARYSHNVQTTPGVRSRNHISLPSVTLGLERVRKSQRRTAFLDYVGNTHFA